MRKKTIAEYEKEITITYLTGNNELAHKIEQEYYSVYPARAIGDVPDKDDYKE